MREHLYGIDSAWIVLALLAAMMLAIEAGWRFGRRQQDASDALREHINNVQGAMLGILALMLGFTFSLALQRFDLRSDAVVEEANAIGTAWLRVDLLPAALRPEAQQLLRRYTDLRVEASVASEIDEAQRRVLRERTGQAQAALWALATRAAQADTNAYLPTMFVDALNTMFDSWTKREAARGRHVPELVLVLMFATFLMAGVTVGLAAGVAGHRPSAVNHVLVLLIAVLVYVIVDLDRPRRGLIEVSQQSLLDQQASMKAAPR